MHLVLLVLVACTHATVPTLANATSPSTVATTPWPGPRELAGHTVMGWTLTAPGAAPVDVFELRGVTRGEIAARLRERHGFEGDRVTEHALANGWLLEVDVTGTRVATVRIIAYREDLGVVCEGAVIGREQREKLEAVRDRVVGTCAALR